MLKDEILDPQGKAIVNAMKHLDIKGFTNVRQGKRFVLEVEGQVTTKHLEAAREAADKLLSNPVIENVVNVSEEVAGESSGGGKTGISQGAVKAAEKLGSTDTDLARIIAASAANGGN
jgi:phosphoribosylformylglycinamidine synthase